FTPGLSQLSNLVGQQGRIARDNSGNGALGACQILSIELGAGKIDETRTPWRFDITARPGKGPAVRYSRDRVNRQKCDGVRSQTHVARVQNSDRSEQTAADC